MALPGGAVEGEVRWLDGDRTDCGSRFGATRRPSWFWPRTGIRPGRRVVGERRLPVLRANHTLRAVPVPAGVSEVEIYFDGGTLTGPLLLSSVSLLLVSGRSFSSARGRAGDHGDCSVTEGSDRRTGPPTAFDPTEPHLDRILPSPVAVRSRKLSIQLLVTAVVTWFILRAVGFNLDELRAFDLSSLSLNWGLLVALLPGSPGGVPLFRRSLGPDGREMSGHEVGSSRPSGVFHRESGAVSPREALADRRLGLPGPGRGCPGRDGHGGGHPGPGVFPGGGNPGGRWGSPRNWEGIGLGRGVGGRWFSWSFSLLPLPPESSGGSCLSGSDWPAGGPRGFRPDPTFGVRWMGLYAFGWVLQGLAFWMLVRGLGSRLTLLEGVPAYPAAYVAGYVVLSLRPGLGSGKGCWSCSWGRLLGLGAAVVASSLVSGPQPWSFSRPLLWRGVT